jgi:hypothetical protein
MKKMMIILAVLGFAGAACAQKDPVSAVFEKYSGAAGFTTVNITGDMLNMLSQVEEQKKDTTFLSRLTDLRILIREKKCSDAQAVDLRSEVYNKLDKKEYKEMMTVKENDQDVVILVKESDGKIHEFLLLVSGKGENVLVQAKGDLLLREMADLAGKCQMKGLEQLKKLEK